MLEETRIRLNVHYSYIEFTMTFDFRVGMYLEMNAFGGRGGRHRALAFMMFRLDALYKFIQRQKGLDALAETAKALRRHVKRMRKKWVQLSRTFP